ncbi:ZIP family metal transporter [Gammaproteobacteria bacterium]|nr:ZIP family metal transporter [Gammaproteobacteria bacterium]
MIYCYTIFSFNIIAGILIFLTSLTAVLYPIKVRAKPAHNITLESADAFASGIFLGAALFHMLPDAISVFSSTLSNITYPIAESFCAFGFLLLLFLERASKCLPGKKNNTNALPYMITIILVIHSLIEGTVLGINSTLETASIIFLAIIIHKGSESFALAVILNPTKLTLKSIIIIVSLFSLMTPLGVFIGAILSSNTELRSTQLVTASFNAFAAGTFLYMSTLHHINHHEKEHESENLTEFLFLLIGMILMATLAWWA